MSANLQPTPSPYRVARMIHEDLQSLRRNWFWFLLLGVALMVLGAVAMIYSYAVTLVAVEVFGVLLIIGGVLFLASSLFAGGWGGFFLGVLAGVLHLAVGFIALAHPTESAVVYTLLLAAFFFVEGLFRVVAALSGQFRHWGWVLATGVITLLLGVLIWRQWPYSGLWVIGTFLGIDLLFTGAAYVNLGLSARSIPEEPQP